MKTRRAKLVITLAALLPRNLDQVRPPCNCAGHRSPSSISSSFGPLPLQSLAKSASGFCIREILSARSSYISWLKVFSAYAISTCARANLAPADCSAARTCVRPAGPYALQQSYFCLLPRSSPIRLHLLDKYLNPIVNFQTSREVLVTDEQETIISTAPNTCSTFG